MATSDNRNGQADTGETSQQDPGDSGDSADVGEFRWKQARENLLSPSGIRMFQLAYAHKGEEYESARQKIDEEYTKLSPRLAARGGNNSRHGGSFINFIGLLEELGLMFREQKGEATYLSSSAAGDQLSTVLSNAPDLLKVVPYFLLDILSRYSLNNPFNKSKKDQAHRDQIRSSDVFPYWTIYKVMRSLGGSITKDELQRFVFKIQKMEQVDDVIAKIKLYRSDSKKHPAEELEAKYGAKIEGAAGQPKYIMGRAGFQSGVIRQEGDTYLLHEDYLPFIDQVLSTRPVFEEVDEASWISTYGDSVDTNPIFVPAPNQDHRAADRAPEIVKTELASDDEILRKVETLLLHDRFGGVILSGAPGTGKSWYARQIALALTSGDQGRIREIQFHPSYQYEDFVEGYTPVSGGGFNMTPKHLLQMCDLAETVSPQPVFLVIDEFSRTDPVRVMGEALTYIEGTLRGKKFSLATGREISIPSNLYFIATMNPEDRSVDEMDAAMERRWAKVELKPSAAKANDFLKENGVPADLRGPIVEFFQSLQEMTPVGHAFFRRIADVGGLARLWESQLVHLLRKQHRYAPEIVGRAQTRFEALQEKLSPSLAEAKAEHTAGGETQNAAQQGEPVTPAQA
jgi:5-methylcytosine-specific restriction enzyme B